MRENDPNEISRAIIAHDLHETLKAVAARINAELARVPLSPTTIYCKKTGAPIGPYGMDALERALAIHGRERLAAMLFSGNLHAVDPAWLETDPQTLDRLIVADPRGYAAYALNILSSHFRKPMPHRDDNNHARLAAYRERETLHHWALARAWQWLGVLSEEQLAKLCDNLCGALTFAPDTIRYLQTQIARTVERPDQLARMAIEGKLIGMLQASVNRVMESIAVYGNAVQRDWDDARGRWIIRGRKRFEDKLRSIPDAARGPSNIRGQKHSRARVEKEKEVSAFAKFMSEQGVDKLLRLDMGGMPKRKPEVKRFGKFAAQPREESELPQVAFDKADLEALADLNFNEIREAWEDDPDTVVVRRISNAEYEAVVARPKPVAVPQPQPKPEPTPEPPRLSIRDRLNAQAAKAHAHAEAERQAREAAEAASKKPAPLTGIRARIAARLAHKETK